MNKISKLANKLISYRKTFSKQSFSQCGEDTIVDFLFELRGIKLPTYIDIGAYHPFALSNTAKFYVKGSRGITIEPNPDQIKYFNRYRKRDTNLNVGVGSENGSLTYFKMNNPTMNTFDQEGAADLVKNHGFRIVAEIQLPIMSISTIVKEHASNRFPDFLSLDVEGFDDQILAQIDHAGNGPKVICVETIEYSGDGFGKKNEKMIGYLQSEGYMVYADTHINTIFVNRKFWEAGNQK